MQSPFLDQPALEAAQAASFLLLEADGPPAEQDGMLKTTGMGCFFASRLAITCVHCLPRGAWVGTPISAVTRGSSAWCLDPAYGVIDIAAQFP